MYSLIQAQYDSAAYNNARRTLDAAREDQEADDDDEEEEPQPQNKRRKLSQDDEDGTDEDDDDDRVVRLVKEEEPELPASQSESQSQQPDTTTQAFTTPKRHVPLSVAQLTSPLSSPPPEELIVPPSSFRYSHPHLAGVAFPFSSSPLSSPPPVLFDPFSDPPDTSASASDTDDAPISQPSFPSSQSSTTTGKLPNMKGRDLFDAQIWSDPLRTSVFYTFATSLRQKIKDAEPTGSHKFISHLRDRGKLVRCYTQNIDQIEEKVGLSTTLSDGPGVKGRFSRRSTANQSQLNKMVEEVSGSDGSAPTSSDKSDNSVAESSQKSTQDCESSQTDSCDGSVAVSSQSKPTLKRETSKGGVECVFLHGSLELLRCFLCGRVCSWEDQDREMETLCGEQPECPHCAGATAARLERGKRALGIGKLRPDIVLYGEEHPNAHLISPIITNDLALYPDMLLILGTSLRVHGLKIMVREFAKAVHSKGGKVVFVNFTKPSESSWGEIIDYWVQWDCDAWVDDLQERIPKLWQDAQPKKPRAQAANPVALRDTKATGAHCTNKILKELQRIGGRKDTGSDGQDMAPDGRNNKATDRRATISALPSRDKENVQDATDATDAKDKGTENAKDTKEQKPKARPKARGPRKSAPGALEKPKQQQQQSSTLNPNHGRASKLSEQAVESPVDSDSTENSILASVKANPRRRKRKVIDGEEVNILSTGRRRTSGSPSASFHDKAYQLPPLRPNGMPFPYGRPQPLEPSSPPSGPLASLSPNLRSSAAAANRSRDLHAASSTLRPSGYSQFAGQSENDQLKYAFPIKETPVPIPIPPGRFGERNSLLEGENLAAWGAKWHCAR